MRESERDRESDKTKSNSITKTGASIISDKVNESDRARAIDLWIIRESDKISESEGFERRLIRNVTESERRRLSPAARVNGFPNARETESLNANASDAVSVVDIISEHHLTNVGHIDLTEEEYQL